MSVERQPPQSENSPDKTQDAVWSFFVQAAKQLFAVVIAPFKYGLAALGVSIAMPLLACWVVVGILAAVAAFCFLLGGVLGLIGLIITVILGVIGLLIASILAIIAATIITVVVGVLAGLLLFILSEIVLSMVDRMTGFKMKKILDFKSRWKKE